MAPVAAVQQPAEAAPARGKLDYDSLLSVAAHSRPSSAIRSLFPLEQEPDMISFLAGKPNSSTFPISKISLHVRPTDLPGSQDVQLDVDGSDLEAGLQYGPTAGLPKLNKWLVEFQCRMHQKAPVTPAEQSRGKAPWRVTVGAGGQDLLTKTFEALLNPGDTILVENPAYTGILPNLQMCHANVVGVDSDAEGLSYNSLASILDNWHQNPATSSQPFPKALYTTPTGANPAGTTASEQRKRDVLRAIRKHGVILLEDDPYYFLSFEGLDDGEGRPRDPTTRPRSRSYWSLEEEEWETHGTGYVMRFESMSKIMSAGLRVGWLSGPVPLLDAIDKHTASANLQPSGTAQLVCSALLHHWGQDGFLRHVDSVARFYRQRRDRFELAARSILGADEARGRAAVAKWVTPVAGMFLWLHLNLGGADGAGGDSFALISNDARKRGVLAVPGVAFVPGKATTSPCVRTSFSVVPEDRIEEGLRRLREVVEEYWRRQGKEVPTQF